MNLRICSPEPGDEKRILELFDRVFERKRGKEFWSWENEQSPCGKSIIALLKDEQEQVRGHLSLLPVQFKVGEEKLTAGQRINSMIEEDWRGGERFKAIFQYLLEKGRERGYRFTYFFPNEQALKATQKHYQVIEVTPMPRYMKFFSGQKAADYLKGIRLPRWMEGMIWSLLLIKNRFPGEARDTVEIVQFDRRFDELWEKVKGDLKVAVERDSTYLNWRYTGSPNRYRIFALEGEAGKRVRGYLVLHREEEQGLAHIADLVVEDKEAVRPLLNRADRAAKLEGCWAISCWILDQGQLSPHLKAGGYRRVTPPNTLALVDINLDEEQKELLRDPQNWYLTIGDSDYV